MIHMIIIIYNLCVTEDLKIFHRCNVTARTRVLSGEVRFDSAGRVPKWLTRFVCKTRNPEPQALHPKP